MPKWACYRHMSCILDWWRLLQIQIIWWTNDTSRCLWPKLTQCRSCYLYCLACLVCLWTNFPTLYCCQMRLYWRSHYIALRTNNKEGIGRSKAAVLLLLIRCWLLLPLWRSVIFPCFVLHCYVSFLVLQSSWWGRERAGFFTFFCLPGVL